MKTDSVILRCEDNAEALVFNRYTYKNLIYDKNKPGSVEKEIDYEINVEDNYIGGEYKGLLGRFRRAWRAFLDKPVVYTGVYSSDKEKIRKFLVDCLNLIDED